MTSKPNPVRFIALKEARRVLAAWIKDANEGEEGRVVGFQCQTTGPSDQCWRSELLTHPRVFIVSNTGLDISLQTADDGVKVTLFSRNIIITSANGAAVLIAGPRCEMYRENALDAEDAFAAETPTKMVLIRGGTKVDVRDACCVGTSMSFCDAAHGVFTHDVFEVSGLPRRVMIAADHPLALSWRELCSQDER